MNGADVSTAPSVAIVGGGLAGLAAAVVLPGAVCRSRSLKRGGN